MLSIYTYHLLYNTKYARILYALRDHNGITLTSVLHILLCPRLSVSCLYLPVEPFLYAPITVGLSQTFGGRHALGLALADDLYGAELVTAAAYRYHEVVEGAVV